MKFNFHFGRSPEIPSQPRLLPEVSPEENSPILEGGEYPNELDLKKLESGDKVFVKTVDGNQYMLKRPADELEKIAMYKKSTDPNATTPWGVSKYHYLEGAVEVKKGEQFVYMIAGNGELIPGRTEVVFGLELHRNTQLQ